MRHHVQMAKYDCLKFLNEAVFTVLMIGISAYLATQNVISTGAVLTSYLCFNQLLKPLEELHRILDELSESMVLAEDYFRLAEIPCDFSFLPLEAAPTVSTEEPETAVELYHVSFAYHSDKVILHDLDLTIPHGMFLGIAGPSGCGKSSLIKAVCKLENYTGTIQIGGRDLRQFSRKELANTIALVPQNPFLIAGTIYENVCYGLERQPPEQEVYRAIDKACLRAFVDSLPDAIHTVLAEGGANLALDNTSERLIQSAIEQLMKETGMTVLSIAHRLTTLKNADRIIVMDGGRIVQSGTYGELIEQDGIFSDMYHGKLK